MLDDSSMTGMKNAKPLATPRHPGAIQDPADCVFAPDGTSMTGMKNARFRKAVILFNFKRFLR